MADQEVRSNDLGYERLGKKRLGLVDVIAQSVGFIGPVFSAAFIIPVIIGANFAAKGAGIAAPLSVVIAAIGIFALGWIVAQYAKRIHAAGSLYDYVSQGLGSTLGATAGWLYYGGTIILTVGLGVLIGWFVHDVVLPGLEISVDIPIWVWDVIWAAILFVVLFFGVQISTRVQLVLALISMAVVLVFMISVIIELGGDNDFIATMKPSGSPTGWSGILFGVLYGVLIFVGFETAANLAEEAAEPKRAIPRAVLTSIVLVAVFYVIAAYTVVAGYGFNVDAIFAANVEGPALVLLAVDPAYGSELILKILLLVVLLDVMAVGVGAAVASTRGVFAMARDRRLPGGLAAVSKYGTPTRAIVLLMVVQGLFIIASEGWTDLFAIEGFPHPLALFQWAATFGAFALVVVYLLMAIGSLRGVGDEPASAGVIVAAIVGILATAGAIYGSFYQVTSPLLIAPWAAVGWFILGLVYMLLVKGREPASQALADLHD